MRRTDNTWKSIVIITIRDGGSDGRRRTKWRDEVRPFAGVGWSTQTLDRVGE